MGAAIQALKLLFFLLTIVVFLPFVMLLYLMGMTAAKQQLLRLFYRLAAWGWRIKVQVKGELAKDRPLILLSNHCSYLDVPVLGQIAPVRFTPKAEVAGWPVIGFLCKLADCVFIDRRRTKTKENQQQLAAVLNQRGIISIFPEGTTNDGSAVGEFRSSYVSLAEVANIPVQPVTVIYRHRNGQPLDRAAMDKVAWYGDMEFAGHLWDYFGTPGVLTEVIFHPPLLMASFPDRKALTKTCQQLVAARYSEIISVPAVSCDQ